MDKRFQKVIETMDTLNSKADKVQEQISTQFLDVRNTQGEISSKLKDVNSRIEKALDDFKSESSRLHATTKKAFDEQRSSMEAVTADTDKALNSFQKECKNNINSHIESINSKSKEILELHSELENIRKIQSDATATFADLSAKQEKLISTIKNEQKNLMDESLIGQLKKQVESFNSRLKKLENNAHSHMFGGKKI